MVAISSTLVNPSDLAAASQVKLLRLVQERCPGARLLVIDPRRIELAEYADVHLPLIAGTNVWQANRIDDLIKEHRETFAKAWPAGWPTSSTT